MVGVMYRFEGLKRDLDVVTPLSRLDGHANYFRVLRLWEYIRTDGHDITDRIRAVDHMREIVANYPVEWI